MADAPARRSSSRSWSRSLRRRDRRSSWAQPNPPAVVPAQGLIGRNDHGQDLDVPAQDDGTSHARICARRAEERPGGKAGKVKSRRQAIAIALKEAGASKYESKSENKRNLARSKRKEAAGGTYQHEREGKSHVGARGKRASSRAMGSENAKRSTGRTPKQRAASRRNIAKARRAHSR